jgi:hypothetical protein
LNCCLNDLSSIPSRAALILNGPLPSPLSLDRLFPAIAPAPRMDTPNASSGSWDFAIVMPLPLTAAVLAPGPRSVLGGDSEANPAVEALMGDREDVADDTEARVIGDGTGEKR